MTTQGPTTVPVKRSHRKVVVEHKYRTEEPKKAGGWHIRMAIGYRRNTSYHVTMTESEVRGLANVLRKYADTIPENSN